MSFDTNIINRHIFSEGSIQVSPAEIVQLNLQQPTAFKASYINTPIVSGYQVFLSGYASKILHQETSIVFRQSLEIAINSLRSNGRVNNIYNKIGSPKTLMLQADYHSIWYRFNSGQVLIYNIELKDNFRLQRDKLERIGAYKIRKNTLGIWESKGKVSAVNTQYAAVNGQSNNLAKATWLMGEHLDFEFGKGTVKEYTLFHNPSVGGGGDTWESFRDKLGVTTEVTKKFSHLLQDTQKSGNETKWMAHSQGGVIFAEAVRYHLNGNSSWSITGGFNGVFRKDKGESLNMHSVAFHGNANNNLRSKVLFDRAGVEVLATRANSYDFVNTLIGANTTNPWRIAGSIVYANHVFSGSPQQSPHTLMKEGFDEWDEQMKFGPGKGRGIIQKSFDALDKTGRKGIEYISNYLK
ncbi:MAG: hypothetical protein GY806_22415 [Gammaproteobacteria bacterium]|nr:hypothetical protein [Gammaproteobacteria bacterium]